MRKRLTDATWEQAKTAFASGIGLRELARNMGLSENTILARARREKWTQQVESAKQLGPVTHSAALTPMHSAAVTMQQRGERYVARMAGVAERVLPHLETLPAAELLDDARNLEQFDRVARRTFGLTDQAPGGGVFNVNILTGQAAVQVSPRR